MQGDAPTGKEELLPPAGASPRPIFADVEAAAQGQVTCRSPGYLSSNFSLINYKTPMVHSPPQGRRLKTHGVKVLGIPPPPLYLRSFLPQGMWEDEVPVRTVKAAISLGSFPVPLAYRPFPCWWWPASGSGSPSPGGLSLVMGKHPNHTQRECPGSLCHQLTDGPSWSASPIQVRLFVTPRVSLLQEASLTPPQACAAPGAALLCALSPPVPET